MSTQNSRSCLSTTFGWVGFGLVIIFLISNLYSVVRMELANRQLFTLARYLGYTPESQLVAGLWSRDPSLVTTSATRVIELYYATPMSKNEFEKTLLTLEPSALLRSGDFQYIGWQRFINFLSNRSDSSTEASEQVTSEDVHAWRVVTGFKVTVELYEVPKTMKLPDYQSRQLTGNLVKMQVDGGTFPAWMMVSVSLWAVLHGY